MNCLVVAATPFEIAPFLDQYRNNAFPFSSKTSLDVLITGIGLTACTYALQKQIQRKRPDIIVQAGIGGCFDNSFALGKVVSVARDRVGDEIVEESNNIKSLFDLGLVLPDQFPYKNEWLVNPDKALLEKTGLTQVSAVSVNQITTSRKTGDFYRERLEATVESMEGAALHYVCLMENISFLQLRALSNYVGERDKGKWKIKESIGILNNELVRVLESL